MPLDNPSNSDEPVEMKLGERAALVAERIELQEVSLLQASARQVAPIAPEGARAKLQVVEVRVQLSPSGGVLEVVPFLRMEGLPPEGSDVSPFLVIEAAFRLRYRVSDRAGLDDSHFDAFGHLNGVFNAWPYWREYVQSMTVRMGYPALTVPVFRFRDTAVRTPPGAPLAPRKS